jgi:hypothetical protein
MTQPRRGIGVTLIVVAIVALALGATIGYGLSSETSAGRTSTITQTHTVTTSVSSTITNSASISSVGTETFVNFETALTACCNNTTGGATFDYPISVSYSGSWILHYWVQNFSGTLNSIEGNLKGSGSSSIWVTFNVVGIGQYTLCASATTVPDDSSQYNPLTLSLFNQNENTTASNPTVEVCGTMAV